MRLVISIAIAITAFVCAAGKVFAEPVSTLELKPNSCGAWIEERSPAYNAPKFREAWLTGFLTGANVWGDFDTDILKNVDTTAVSAWIDNYCKANPLEKLNKAVTQLIRDLADRAKKNK